MKNRTSVRASFIFAFVFFACAFSLHAQENRPANAPSTEADENFTLDIKESTVRESNYYRATAVEIAGDGNRAGVAVRVGAEVRAESIVITLRGVTGNVRFRASLEKITRLLK